MSKPALTISVVAAPTQLGTLIEAIAILADVAAAATSAHALDAVLRMLDETAADATAPETHRSSVRMAAMALRGSAGRARKPAPAATPNPITREVH